MNVKMATDLQLLTTESKKQTKQNRNRIIDMEIIWRVTSWEGAGGRMGGCARIKKYTLVGTK